MNEISNTFILEKNRTQWSHLSFIFIPFSGLILLILLLTTFKAYLPEQFVQVLGSALGLSYALYIFTLPKWMRKGKKACHRSLILKDQKIILFDTKKNSIITESHLTNDIALPGKFHYKINARFYAGTYRAPIITIKFEPNRIVHIGVYGCNLEWGSNVPQIAKPDYILQVDDWIALSSNLGLGTKLIKVVDTKIR